MMTALLTLWVSLASQLPAPPPPPAPPQGRAAGPEMKGSAIIRGHARTAEGRPLRRVQVRVTGAGSQGRNTTTGLEGEYEISELPAGRFTVQFSRAGYLPVFYGQRSPGEPGAPLEVAAGAKIDNIDAVMLRGGVVTGRVVDESGDPVAGVTMWPMQQQFFRGRRQVVPVTMGPGHDLTDDAGHYRITSLPPGEYLIIARLRDTWMSDEKEPQTLAYAPTYFPGTASLAEARRVKVVAGQEVGAIDLTLVPVRASKISGSVVDSTGAPFTSGTASLTQEIRGPSGGMMSMAGNTRIAPDGTFTLRDVPPGDYTLRATGSSAGRPPESVTEPISVMGNDIIGLVVAADPGALISGTVVTDTGGPLPAGNVTVITGPVSMQQTAVRTTAGKDDGQVQGDGTFTRRSVSGDVVLRLGTLPRGWAVKSILIDGRDHTGRALQVRAGQQISGATIVISNRLPPVSGRLKSPTGNSAGGTVLLFPADETQWIEAGANQRTARPDQSGVFRFDSVRPGEYFVVALETMQQWQMNDPEFLAEQKKHATKITVGEEAVSIGLEVRR